MAQEKERTALPGKGLQADLQVRACRQTCR
jgi:hypothetical protein